MNSDTLTGRELDAAVASDLFGLEVREELNAGTRRQDHVCCEHGEQWTRFAFYSSTSASLNVNERLYKLGWKIREGSSNRWPDPTGVYHARSGLRDGLLFPIHCRPFADLSSPRKAAHFCRVHHRGPSVLRVRCLIVAPSMLVAAAALPAQAPAT